MCTAAADERNKRWWLVPASLFISLGTSLLAFQIRHLLTLCAFINFTYLVTYLFVRTRCFVYFATLSLKVKVKIIDIHRTAVSVSRDLLLQVIHNNISDVGTDWRRWMASKPKNAAISCLPAEDNGQPDPRCSMHTGAYRGTNPSMAPWT